MQTNPLLPSIVLISPLTEDHIALGIMLLDLKWKISAFHTIAAAAGALEQASVVVCDAEMPDGSWKRVMQWLETMPRPPMLIVTSRYADNRLWAEVLHEGGHDVLGKPFRRLEVQLSTASAMLRWENARNQIPEAGARDLRLKPEDRSLDFGRCAESPRDE